MIKNINVPEKLNDITLRQYQQYMAIASDDIDTDLKNKSALFIFYGINKDMYKDMRAKDITYLINEINKVFAMQHEFVQRFTFKGIDFGFIPNLNDITFGELADLDKYSEVKDFHKLMSILYRPIVKTVKDRYEILKYKGSNDALLDMPLGICLGAVGFFLTLGFQLMEYTLKSLKVSGTNHTLMSILEKSGVGMEAFSPWRTKI